MEIGAASGERVGQTRVMGKGKVQQPFSPFADRGDSTQKFETMPASKVSNDLTAGDILCRIPSYL